MRLRVILFVILCSPSAASLCFAQETVYDRQHRFEVIMPCEPIRIPMTMQDRTVLIYNCYENYGDRQNTYYVNITSKSDGKPIRYRQNDINKAIKYEIFGFLFPYGGNEHNIYFANSNRIGKYPAFHYHSTSLRGGKMAEGVGAFINGKHYRIGIVYDSLLEDRAKAGLDLMLDSFKLR